MGMVLGFGIVALGQIEDVRDLIPQNISGFEILSVDQDPVTGAIRGNLVLGNADLLVSVNTPVKKNSFGGAPCPSSVQGTSIGAMRFGSGSSSGGCGLGYAEWDLSELPDDFVITSGTLDVKVHERSGVPKGMVNRICIIGIHETAYDLIPRDQLVIRANNPDSVLTEGTWCQTVGKKTIILDQNAIDSITRALKTDDKFTISMTLAEWTKGTLCCWTQDHNFWANEGSFTFNGFAEPIQCAVGEHQVGFQCEPLICDVGEEVNGNICSPIQCAVGDELIGSVCKPIECNVGERLVGNNCEQIICTVGTTLIGNTCEPIVCETGFVLSGNTCTTIVCPTGNELIGNECQQIQCQQGTFLQGNNCIDIVCATGTLLEGDTCIPILCNEGSNLIGNICKPIECNLGEQLVGNQCQTIACDTGEELIGDECLPIQCASDEKLEGDTCVTDVIECPVGTIANRNVCIQIVPQLQATGAPTDLLTIAGLGILLISFTGFVFRGIKNRGL